MYLFPKPSYRKSATPNIERAVIGGDFNAVPNDINQLINQGTPRTIAQRAFQQRFVENSGMPTQGNPPNQELDFFIYMGNPGQDGLLPIFQATQVNNVAPSDHNPVETLTDRF